MKSNENRVPLNEDMANYLKKKRCWADLGRLQRLEVTRWNLSTRRCS